MSANVSTSTSTSPQNSESWWSQNRRRALLGVRFLLIFAVLGVVVWKLLFSPIAVTSHSMQLGSVYAEVLGTGTLEARTSAVVGPKIGGLIVSIEADQGDHVQAGALLFRLEDSAIQQQVSMAEFDASASIAAVDRLRSSEQKAEAVLIQARSNFKRLSELRLSDITAQQDLDRAQESLSIAQAELATASAAILEGESQRSSAEQYLEYQRARLRDTTVEAPFDALVVRRDREQGDVVAAGASVFQLIDVSDEMWVSAWVDETELARLEIGQLARVVFRSEPDAAYVGLVSRVGREVDRETREVVVDVVVERLPENWAVGQRAEAYIQVDARDSVLVLPAALLLREDGKAGVMLNQGGKSIWREIELGLHGRENLEILNGLEAGDEVVRPVASDTGKLREGRRVQAQ